MSRKVTAAWRSHRLLIQWEHKPPNERRQLRRLHHWQPNDRDLEKMYEHFQGGEDAEGNHR